MSASVIGGSTAISQPYNLPAPLGPPAAPINTANYGPGSATVLGGSRDPLPPATAMTLPPATSTTTMAAPAPTAQGTPIVQTVDPTILAQYQATLGANLPAATPGGTPGADATTGALPGSLPGTTGTATGDQIVYGVVDPADLPPATPLGGPAEGEADPAPAPEEAPPAEEPAPPPAPRKVTVKSGDTLSGIAAAAGVDMNALYEANKDIIGGDPNLIRPGQEFTLP